MSQGNGGSTARLIIVFIVIVAAFWLAIVFFMEPEPPEIVYNNETEITPVMNNLITVELNEYQQIPLDVQKGDVLNTTITVVSGGPIDYFILEEDRIELLIDALEGNINRFDSYERGRGLNITMKSSEFIIVSDDDWYIFLNNYGHVQNGAKPFSKVRVRVEIEKIGFIEETGFSYTS